MKAILRGLGGQRASRRSTRRTASIKDAIKRAAELEQASSPSRASRDLERARTALRTPVAVSSSQEPDIADDAPRSAPRRSRTSSRARPSSGSCRRSSSTPAAIEAEYERRFDEALDARVAAYSEALRRARQGTPGWAELDEDQRAALAAPLERGADATAQASVADPAAPRRPRRLRRAPAARRSQELSRASSTASASSTRQPRAATSPAASRPRSSSRPRSTASARSARGSSAPARRSSCSRVARGWTRTRATRSSARPSERGSSSRRSSPTQLEGDFDILRDGACRREGRRRTSTPRQAFQRERIVAAIEHKRAAGMSAAEAVADYLRDAAFTTLNRFVALKMLEARELVQECVTKGEQSSGLPRVLRPGAGPRRSCPTARATGSTSRVLFDELSTEVKVLFDRRDPAAVLWPQARGLRAAPRDPERHRARRRLGRGRDDRLGLPVLQQRRRAQEDARGEPGAAQQPRARRPQPVLHAALRRPVPRRQHARPHLVARCAAARRELAEPCEYLVRPIDEPFGAAREEGSARPARSSTRPAAPGTSCSTRSTCCSRSTRRPGRLERGARRASSPGGRCARTTRSSSSSAEAAPGADPRAQPPRRRHRRAVRPDRRARALAARAARLARTLGIRADERPRITRTHIVVAEPMPGDRELVAAFADELRLAVPAALFSRMVEEMRLAGELGHAAPGRAVARRRHPTRAPAVRGRASSATLFPDLRPATRAERLDLSGVTDDSVFDEPRTAILRRLSRFASRLAGDARRRLFADDAAQGVALIDLVRTRSTSC